MSYMLTTQDSEGFGDVHYTETEDEAYDLGLDEMMMFDDEFAVFSIENEETGEIKTYTRDGELLW